MPIPWFQRTTESAESQSKVHYSVAEVNIKQHAEPAETHFIFINNIAELNITT